MANNQYFIDNTKYSSQSREDNIKKSIDNTKSKTLQLDNIEDTKINLSDRAREGLNKKAASLAKGMYFDGDILVEVSKDTKGALLDKETGKYFIKGAILDDKGNIFKTVDKITDTDLKDLDYINKTGRIPSRPNEGNIKVTATDEVKKRILEDSNSNTGRPDVGGKTKITGSDVLKNIRSEADDMGIGQEAGTSKIDDVIKDGSKVVDELDNKAKTTVAKIVDEDPKKIGSFLKANPKIAKLLQSKWTKLGGKAVIPVTIAYNALKDLEVFNEGKADFSGNIASDTGEVLKSGAKGVVDAGTNLAVNLGTDVVTIGDSILKGLAWGLGQASDIGKGIQYIGASDESRKEMDKDKTDYSQMFYKAIDDLGISNAWEANANKTKAGMKEFLYGTGDDKVYQKTLDKYNKKSGIDEYGNEVKPSDIEGIGVADDSNVQKQVAIPNVQPTNVGMQPLTYQDRKLVKDPTTGTWGYESKKTGLVKGGFKDEASAKSDIDQELGRLYTKENVKQLERGSEAQKDFINKGKLRGKLTDKDVAEWLSQEI